MKKNRLYLYLARLDRKGIEVIAGFPHSKKVYATRIKDVVTLALPPDMTKTVQEALRSNRMTHELYAESAPSFEDLKSELRNRGYSNLPLQQFSARAKAVKVNERALMTKSSTMVQRVRK